jgi:uncharacterized membrane protein YfcA
LLDFLIAEFSISGVNTYVFIPPLVSFLISFFTSMAGVSGAFLLLPFQMSVLGFTTPSVSSTNLLYNVIGTPGGIYRYMKEGRMTWPVALIIIVGIIPGILIGYYLRVKYLPDPRAFKFFVGIVLMYVALRLLRDVWTSKGMKAKDTSKGTYRVENTSIGVKITRFDFRGVTFSFITIGLLMLSFFVGIIGGVYGIGGGAIIAPLCITFFKMPAHAIAGAVLLGTFTSSIAGVTFYSLIPVHGAVAVPDWPLGILFGLGGLLGMYSGAKLQKNVSEKWIKLILGTILFIVALRYILRFFNV